MDKVLAEPSLAPDVIAHAQTSADTGYVLLCAALVLLMTPGFAFFYGGFVRERNVLNTMMMSFILMALVGVTWVLWGYSLSFSPGLPFIGGLQWLGLNGVSHVDSTGYLPHMVYENALHTANPNYSDITSYSPTIPHQAFTLYQAMYAIITPALISGAIVERVSFRAYFLFVLLWSTLIYCPIAHMVWAKGGFIGKYGGFGALDFAGGTVVHVSAGVSALVAAWVTGPRQTYPTKPAAPHNVPFILLGTGLLWFGWLGFNSGNALASGSLATVAFMSTNTAAAGAALTWTLLETWSGGGKPTAIGLASGAIAGLVGVTPSAGLVTPLGALLIGVMVALCCFFAVSLRARLEFDDSLDTFPVHGVGGTVGAILTGIFATTAVNPAGVDGLLFGNPSQVLKQLAAVGITYVLAGVGTLVILKILDVTVGLRVKPDKEIQGMDINEHGEQGYGDDFASGLNFTERY
ncbi:MAG: ammonium transporter [Chroococcidiopsidaceae cyanobacterium CP_BM_ER_R8_30]|nr:ammonium transporter [Chroococcidiopsidaceae cyanobacterium CP_BM_ER_R8_30]